MKRMIIGSALAVLLLLGGVGAVYAAERPDAGNGAAIEHYWGNRGHRGGGGMGHGYNRDGDQGGNASWRCGGGNYHQGPDRGGYSCH